MLLNANNTHIILIIMPLRKDFRPTTAFVGPPLTGHPRGYPEPQKTARHKKISGLQPGLQIFFSGLQPL
jgi:hypothetical protein